MSKEVINSKFPQEKAILSLNQIILFLIYLFIHLYDFHESDWLGYLACADPGPSIDPQLWEPTWLVSVVFYKGMTSKIQKYEA